MSTTLCHSERLADGSILLLTLDNGPANSVTPEMLRCLGRELDAFESTGALQLAIMRGEGSVFSKGFDVSVIRAQESPATHRRHLLIWNDVCSRLAESPKPVIAAINGPCLGAGLELALACHLRLCVEKAWLGLPELGQGLLPGLGGIHRLVELVGRARALELMIAGGFVKSEDALAWGLVNRVLPKASFFDDVLAFAQGILAVDPTLVREVIQLTNAAPKRGDQDNVQATIDSIVRCVPATKD